MEDVLDLYEAPYDPAHPVVCFDESPKQRVGEVREPTAPEPGPPPARTPSIGVTACATG